MFTQTCRIFIFKTLIAQKSNNSHKYLYKFERKSDIQYELVYTYTFPFVYCKKVCFKYI